MEYNWVSSFIIQKDQMKQRRKVKSLLSHKRYGSNFLLTALLLMLSVMLCIWSVSLMTMRTFAADHQFTSITYEWLDDNTEVVYNVDFVN